jgi:hypothetical protein
MLFPVVLFGAIWADLDRPVREAEVAGLVRLWVQGKWPPAPASRAYYFLRGRIRAARIREGMMEAEVESILGAEPWRAEFGMGLSESCHYNPLGVVVCYRPERVRVNGEDRWGASVLFAEGRSLADIVALFLPDRPRRR